MPRKKQPVHASGLVEVKATIGKTLDGKRIQKSFYGHSKLDAQKKADEYKLEQELANRTGDMFIKKEYTFGEWANKWLEVYKKPNTSENTYKFTYENTVEKHLKPYFGKASLTSIRSVDVQNFFATKTEYSESMLDKMRNCLTDIFSTAIDNDLCFKNPVKNIKITSTAKKNIKRVLSDNEIEKLILLSIEAMPEIPILLTTGIRRGELLGLQWGDIDFKNGLLTVNRSIADSKEQRIKVNPPKWGSVRIIPLQQRTVDLLKSLPRNSEYVFTNDEGDINSPNTWAQRLGRFMRTVGGDIPAVTAHEMRHTYGTALRRQGVDIYTIQKVMGHKDIQMTTELYVHNEVDELKKAMMV